jgi:hypothetical protein
MEPVNGNEMLRQWARMEHYRLHCAESWEDGSYKDAVVTTIRSALERLEAASGSVGCAVCTSRKKTPSRVLMFPSRSNIVSEVSSRAA